MRRTGAGRRRLGGFCARVKAGAYWIKVCKLVSHLAGSLDLSAHRLLVFFIVALSLLRPLNGAVEYIGTAVTPTRTTEMSPLKTTDQRKMSFGDAR